MRVAEPDISNLPAANREVVDQTIKRRGALGLLQLDYALFHSFPLAEGWNAFFSALKRETVVPVDLCEIAICRVALHLGADYQWRGHITSLRECEGMDEPKLSVVETRFPVEPGALSELQWTVLQFADRMTVVGRVAEHLFQELFRLGLSEREAVELTAITAAYNCVGRFLLTLGIN
jgi:alkylhydroperoxidase family enzyme